MASLIRYIDRFTELVGHILSWLCLGTMLATVLVVLMRYLFQAGNMAAYQETITYLHATVFMLALGWTFKRNGHVRVDVFYRNYSLRTKAWINSLGILVFLLPFCAFLFFASLDFVALSWSISETSNESGGLPIVYLLKSLIPLMCVFLALQATAELLRNACILCCQDEDRSVDDSEAEGNPS